METNLSGLDAPSAKEYIYGFLSALKMTEKKIEEVDADIAKWDGRAGLAKSKGALDLEARAQKQAGEFKEKRRQLAEEAAHLKSQIDSMQRQLPGLAARQRSVDPDLLEQELLMAAGYSPCEEDKAKSARQFGELEKEAAADDALSALKAKMGK